MKLDPITGRIEHLMSLLVEDHANVRVERSPQLDVLFDLLRQPVASRDLAETEQQIWALWCSHVDATAARKMRTSISQFEAGDLEAAGRTMDGLIERWPTWAEPWNKRATLRFVQQRDADSLEDIRHTLELEPRHFGALGGFGQICLRAGEPHVAIVAFERALAINPNLDAIRTAVESLRREHPLVQH